MAVAAASSTSDTIDKKWVRAPRKDYEKRAVLRGLIDEADNLNNGIIFCNRKRDVATLYKSLSRHEYSVGSLHGDMDQSTRTKTLAGFRSGEIKLLVASDVAARGLDIPDVSHVFNYDVPTHAEDYVHRIGRCGRAGRDGWAFTMVTKADDKYVQAIAELTGDDIEWLDGGKPTTSTDEASEATPEKKKSSRKRTKKADKESETVAKDAVEGEERTTRRPRKKKPVEAEDAAVAAPVAADDTEAAPTQPDRPSDNDDMPIPKGWGDHVPAFLLQPTRKFG